MSRRYDPATDPPEVTLALIYQMASTPTDPLDDYFTNYDGDQPLELPCKTTTRTHGAASPR